VSNLDRRRRDRRRRSSGGMHPGWACFMAAHWGGFALGIGFVAVIRWAFDQIDGSLPIAAFVIWVFLLILGGKKAERLREDCS